MILLYLAVFLVTLSLSTACSCPRFIGELELEKDPVYRICRYSYLTRITLSKLENYTCVQDEVKNDPCYMKAQVIEDFFAPLKEAGRQVPNATSLKGDLNSPQCGVSLPEPGDYIMNAFLDGSSFRENVCEVYREPYSDKLASEIREMIKKCPKERLDYEYWRKKGAELDQIARTRTTRIRD